MVFLVIALVTELASALTSVGGVAAAGKPYLLLFGDLLKNIIVGGIQKQFGLRVDRGDYFEGQFHILDLDMAWISRCARKSVPMIH
uniref:Uncharacterized protein n=1 Tax=Romanomermis culicivorax TaxID=13658 RepID=A0A915KTK1_ROMCU